MSIERISTLLEITRKNGHDVWHSIPATKESVATLEEKIQAKLPATLTWILETYGALGIYDNYLSGIIDNDPLAMEGGNIYADTVKLREDNPLLPEYCWVLCCHEDGAYCFCYEDIDKPSIVNFEHGSIAPLAKTDDECLENIFLRPWAGNVG